ncbi:N-acetylmuramoyl-L-alanine amidase [Clostridium baratii]|uniref:N-acetylmuramoyl-L-alanine amidase n=1 Tax=Clostridium baratii TaxID=1561 RepID=UPI0006BADEEB|nr:N-acetylmuramoyl-L-alanine amidase [Clostridium baratii]
MSNEIKKIAVRGGHNFQAKGTSGIIDETTEDRKVKDATIKYLRDLGYEVLDVTPGNCNVNTDLAYGVNKANEWGADLFISIHFNNAYSSYNGALGTEVCVYNKFDKAQRVVDGIASLGFKNRGQKVEGNRLYELRNTDMKAMIVEVCFVEATKDVELYKKLGADTIGKKIAESIANKKVTNSTPQKPTSTPSTQNYKLVPQRGRCTVLVDELNIREKPSIKSKSVGSYRKGESVNYDYYVDNEGYRWISWVGASGNRRYMAVRVLSTNKKYGNCV